MTYKFTTFEDVAATRPVHAGAESAGTDAVRPRYCALGPVDATAANPIRPNRSPPLLPLPSAAFFFFLLLPRCSFFAARPAAASSSPPPVPAPRWPCPTGQSLRALVGQGGGRNAAVAQRACMLWRIQPAKNLDFL